MSNLVSGQGVVEWVAEGSDASIGKHAQAIGLLRDGKLIAGVVYDRYTVNNIFAHQRIIAQPSREYWIAITHYPFIDLDCKRVTVTVDEGNIKSMNIVKRMGFVEEGRLQGAGRTGNDYVILVLWRDNCRMLNWKAQS